MAAGGLGSRASRRRAGRRRHEPPAASCLASEPFQGAAGSRGRTQRPRSPEPFLVLLPGSSIEGENVQAHPCRGGQWS